MNKKKYPMKMQPYFKETVWGGDAISALLGKSCPRGTGEAWEISSRKGCESIIANGALAGASLSEYFGNNDFPLLIKFIDATDKLSVQVHPAEKNELWYVIGAKQDAQIIYGVRDNVCVKDIAAAAGDDIEGLLRKISVKAGDAFYIPAGQIHAIGEGILVAEIQQNSDTTYRLYDYGRPRELHMDKALEEVKIRPYDEIEKLRYIRSKNGIADCEYFSFTEHCNRAVITSSDGFTVIIAVEGNGTLSCGGEVFDIYLGDVYLLPLGCPAAQIEGDIHILEVKQ